MNRAFKIIVSGGILLIVLMIVINSAIYFATKSYIHENVASAPQVKVVLIPGAAVFPHGSLSPIFTDRVDTAVGLYEAGKADQILVSGDNSTDSYNEVNPVREYLLSKGVADGDIFLDYAGFDTYSTMYRAREIFGVTSVIISTQSFHLPRAVYIARELGLDAQGINADKGHILFKNYTREILATEKAVLDIWTNRQPKFLGEQIPMDSIVEEENTEEGIETGDSEVTECNADAKICPDGSSVARIGSQCEFMACPALSATSALITVPLGESATALNVTVSPKELVLDNRCPKEVLCIWGGTVEVKTVLTTKSGHGEHVMTLGTPQVFGDYTVTLTGVSPKSSKDGIAESAYRFTYELTKS